MWGFIGDEYEGRQGATEASRRVSGFRVCGAFGFGSFFFKGFGFRLQVLCEGFQQAAVLGVAPYVAAEFPGLGLRLKPAQGLGLRGFYRMHGLGCMGSSLF